MVTVERFNILPMLIAIFAGISCQSMLSEKDDSHLLLWAGFDVSVQLLEALIRFLLMLLL